MHEHDTNVADNSRTYAHYRAQRRQRDLSHVRSSIIALIITAILFAALVAYAA